MFGSVGNKTDARRATGQRLGRPASDSEARLVAAASSGDAAAFDQLRAHHEPALTEFCAKMLEHRHQEAPGVVAETFAAARRELPVKDARVQLRPWLYALAFERCVARLDDERPAGGALGQGEPRDQQRGAALMLGALPQAELVSLMGLAGSRPALFGLISELSRSAPGFLGALAVDQAAGQALAALGVLPSSGGRGGEKIAQHRAQLGPVMTAQGAAKGPERAWNGARLAAATAGVLVIGGATTFALADPIGTNAQRGGAAVQPKSGAAPPGTKSPGLIPRSGDDAAGGRTGGPGRDGAAAPAVRTTGGGRDGRDGRDGATARAASAGQAGAGSDGLNGADGSPGNSGSAGSSGSDGTNGSDGTGGGTGPGGGSAEERSLLKLDVEVGDIEAHVRVP